MNSLPTVLVLVGISGDLSKRKLLPAIENLAKEGKIGDNFRVLGVSRRNDLSLSSLFTHTDGNFLKDHAEILNMNMGSEEDYLKLRTRLEEIENELGGPVSRIFYLSVPPKVSKPIIGFLGQSGLSRSLNTKLLLEKPFGVDLPSAREMAALVRENFDPKDVYLVDHYLAKDGVMDLSSGVGAENDILEKIFKEGGIKSITITASESLGIEGRVNFYEETGALRDLIQSHLLEVLSILLIDRVESKDKQIMNMRLESLKKLSLHSSSGKPAVMRGQYEGYKDEVENEGSRVETFASVELRADDERLQGVPIMLRTGKAFDKKYTEIEVIGSKDSSVIYLDIQNGNAYAHVIEGAMNGNNSLFVSVDEALETWRIIDPVVELWKQTAGDLLIYKKGISIEEISKYAKIEL
jgi:glucose-6-phosphate 1-dehydrogenase